MEDLAHIIDRIRDLFFELYNAIVDFIEETISGFQRLGLFQQAITRGNNDHYRYDRYNGKRLQYNHNFSSIRPHGLKR